ncbi:MAG: efflux RND transporter permease subunit [Defluviitaleaceae bacterium]|nr:efflux RND transporter permease subunit [Defluviitaleaceae bacterium]
MIKLTETVVKRPIAALVVILAIIVFGVMSILTMPQELMPDMNMPIMMILTPYPSAGPADVEELVSDVIAGAVGTENGISNVISYSSENVSQIMLQFEYGTDMDRAYNEISRSLDRVKNDLPSDAMEPVIMLLDINGDASIQLSLHSATRERLLQFVQDEIVPQFERLPSVANVEVIGGREEYVSVELSEEKLHAHNLTMQNVLAALGGVNHTAPLGSAVYGDRDFAVRVQVKHESLEALSNIPLSLPTGGVIRLGDVTNIGIATRDDTSISRHDSSESITINISPPQRISPNIVSADVTRVLERITKQYDDLSVVIIIDTSDLIQGSIKAVAETLIMAIILSMIILFLFLGDIRASLIVGSSMPISLLITFAFMNLIGFTMNVVSLSGLIIGVGMMVDNAIVVIDSCFRSNKKKKNFVAAAIDGTRFVMLSVFAATLTTSVVFLPISLIDGIAGQMFSPLGLSIVFALLASLISAVTLVPLFFVKFKPVEKDKAPVTKIFKKLENAYVRLLGVTLRKKKTVAAITIGIVVLSLVLFQFLNMELMPSADEGMVRIRATTRPGLNLESIDEIAKELEAIAEAHPDVSHYTVAGNSGGVSLTAFLHSNRKMHTNEIIEQWRYDTLHILNADINVSSTGMVMMDMGGGGGVEITLNGTSLDGIREGVALVEQLMHENEHVIRVNSSLSRANPQAEIVVDPMLAASYNLSPQMVTGSVFLALNGSKPAEIEIDKQRFDIRVEYPKGRYAALSDVHDMLLMSPTGALVPLSAISTIESSDVPQTISRQNGLYNASVTAIVPEAARFLAQSEIKDGVANLQFPDGVGEAIGLATEMQNRELTSLLMAVVTSVFLVFLLLAIQFESIRNSLMVMTCVPLAVIGSFLFMILTGTTISMVSMLGFLILIGTVVNNGILYVDAVNHYREEMEVKEALMLAGRTRLRPIFMTTLTTIISMLPLALGFGEEMMQGLGVTVVGGLTASTVLALLFLPTFYLLVDGNPNKRAARKQKRIDNRERKIAEHMG